MKISLYIPKGSKRIKPFLEKELATAKNIKEKQTRESVLNGLSAMIRFAQGI